MIKKVLALGLITVSLTGCIVAPYDDHPNRQGHDRDHPRWDNDRHKPNWNRDRDDHRRDWDHRR